MHSPQESMTPQNSNVHHEREEIPHLKRMNEETPRRHKTGVYDYPDRKPVTPGSTLKLIMLLLLPLLLVYVLFLS
jgi:hypothetical protein